MLSADIPEGEEKWESLENIYKHFASEAETRGHLAGARGRARRSGRDLEEIVDEAVDQIFKNALEYGYTVEELTPVIQAIWKKWTDYLKGWN
jgi:CRISPR/Cas system CSM-associated protein Csm2 small subunit